MFSPVSIDAQKYYIQILLFYLKSKIQHHGVKAMNSDLPKMKRNVREKELEKPEF